MVSNSKDSNNTNTYTERFICSKAKENFCVSVFANLSPIYDDFQSYFGKHIKGRKANDTN